MSTWQRPARTRRTLENRLTQTDDPELLLFELQRFRDSRCGARTRKGTPCKRAALANHRCRNHGGLSCGPRTPEGRRRSLSCLKQLRADPELLEAVLLKTHSMMKALG